MRPACGRRVPAIRASMVLLPLPDGAEQGGDAVAGLERTSSRKPSGYWWRQSKCSRLILPRSDRRPRARPRRSRYSAVTRAAAAMRMETITSRPLCSMPPGELMSV